MAMDNLYKCKENINKEPLVSVVMSAYNAEKTIGATIKSILRQSYQKLELIIVDDASQDQTLSIIKSFPDPRIKLICNQTNLTLGPSLNIALEAARGEFIARQDADDLSLPDRLEKQVKYLLANPEVDVVGSYSYIINGSGTILGGMKTKGLKHEELILNISLDVPFIHPTVMAKASWYRKYRYRSYPRSQDRDLWLRAYQHSRFASLPEFIYAYRDPGRIQLKKLFLASGTNLLMRIKHYREYGLPATAVLIYPLILGGKWTYWSLLALQGKSVFASVCQKLPKDAKLQKDQAWIYNCHGLEA